MVLSRSLRHHQSLVMIALPALSFDEWVIYVVLIGYSPGSDGIIWPSLYPLRVQVINDESWLPVV
jgi:hypothetical protein